MRERTEQQTKKRGAVSLYVVIFATLLVTVIALGFTRIMLNERDQVIDTDLSQTAYDSAMTGIEDAKLAVLKYNQCLSAGTNAPTECNGADGVISTIRGQNPRVQPCDVVPYLLDRDFANGSSTDPDETIIDEGGSDATFDQLDQAYTCVRVSDDTVDFLSRLDAQTRARIIPLRTAGVAFDQVVISWSMAGNAVSTSCLGSASQPLFGADWPECAPPVLAASVMQSGTSFRLSDFETATSGSSNRGQMVLVPVRSGGNNAIASNALVQTADQLANDPFPITCVDPARSSSGYACTVTINLPSPVGGGTRHDGTAFLMLESLYPSTAHDFQVKLQRNGTAVPLVGVQVAVDSTGRNADLLRRIEGRIEVVDTAFPYPEWTVQLDGDGGGSFCKNFIVTVNNWVSPSRQNVFNRASC